LPRDLDHPRCRVDPRQPVTLPGELAGDEPGTAAEVDDRDRADLGRELRVETRLRIGRVRVDRVVDRNQPRIRELSDARRGGAPWL
jgi:hypothetical protein